MLWIKILCTILLLSVPSALFWLPGPAQVRQMDVSQEEKLTSSS